MHQYQIPEVKFHLHALGEGVYASSFLSKHRQFLEILGPAPKDQTMYQLYPADNDIYTSC